VQDEAPAGGSGDAVSAEPIDASTSAAATGIRTAIMSRSGLGGDGSAAAAPLHQTSVMLWFLSGKERMRFPVALKYALSTAGAATQIVGSPTPPHGSDPPVGI